MNYATDGAGNAPPKADVAKCNSSVVAKRNPSGLRDLMSKVNKIIDDDDDSPAGTRREPKPPHSTSESRLPSSLSPTRYSGSDTPKTKVSFLLSRSLSLSSLSSDEDSEGEKDIHQKEGKDYSPSFVQPHSSAALENKRRDLENKRTELERALFQLRNELSGKCVDTGAEEGERRHQDDTSQLHDSASLSQEVERLKNEAEEHKNAASLLAQVTTDARKEDSDARQELQSAMDISNMKLLEAQARLEVLERKNKELETRIIELENQNKQLQVRGQEELAKKRKLEQKVSEAESKAQDIEHKRTELERALKELHNELSKITSSVLKASSQFRKSVFLILRRIRSGDIRQKCEVLKQTDCRALV
jgi:DNA repair exonuclease SbcCD ATPase subunit